MASLFKKFLHNLPPFQLLMVSLFVEIPWQSRFCLKIYVKKFSIIGNQAEDFQYNGHKNETFGYFSGCLGRSG